jgi:hypothetical protein
MTARYLPEMLEEIAKSLVFGYGGLAVQITHTSRSNMSYRYKIWHFTIRDGDGKLDHVTWAVANLTGEKLTDQGEIRGNGIGFDRRLDARNRFITALTAAGYFDQYAPEVVSGLLYTARHVDL